ncbi:MAG: hypothetical protein IIB44_06750 [Candidatus Marinimicrobia bacterium]|nr:hypothetical protein [Candidatus Neomarinimicrobiota bacterium]
MIMKIDEMTCFSKIIIFVSIICHWGSSQPINDKFDHLTTFDGLSQNTVYAIVQDQSGFMWFGTEDGLNKYDGYEFTQYYPESGDSAGLSASTIYDLIVDPQGKIWIATYNGGLCRYDPEKNEFTQYRHQPGNPHSISSDYLITLYLDSKGQMWICTDGGGLNRYDPDTETFIHYTHTESDSNSISDNYVYAIEEDPKGYLWVGTSNGLNRLDFSTNSNRIYLHSPNDSLSLTSNYIIDILMDRLGNLWVGTDKGLSKYDREEDRFTNYTHNPGDLNSLSDNQINCLYEDLSGRLWIGTENGLNSFNREKNSFKRFVHDYADPNSLGNNYIYSIFEDRSGTLWIGTGFDGVNTLYNRQKSFDHYVNNKLNPNLLAKNEVFALLTDDDNQLWVGTINGLTRLDIESMTSGHYMHSPSDDHSISNNSISKIFKDRFNRIWIGTDKGLNLYDPQTNSFKRYYPSSESKNYWSANLIIDIAQSKDGFFWLGTAKGVYQFDPIKEIFSHFSLPEIEDTMAVWVVTEDRDGWLWIGTDEKGVYRINPAENTIQQFLSSPDDSSGIINYSINEIYEDSRGDIWVGTYGGGLSKFNFQTNRFTHYTMEDGLPNNTVYGMLEDNQGYLWLSTNKGLSKFDPIASTYQNFDYRDGLQSDEFNGGAYEIGQDGRMYFGGVNGITAFYPDSIKMNPFIPPIVFTDFLLFDKPMNISEYQPSSPALQSISHLQLTHEDLVFTIKFAALNYYLTDKIQYAYQLVGFDEHWTYSGNKRSATYTSLPPGDYSFRVKGTNNDGLWNESGNSVRLTVLPPYWVTWWFRGIIILIIGLFAATAYHLRIRFMRRRNAELQSSNEFKDLLLDIISHDLRNPAGVVHGMATLLEEEIPDDEMVKVIKSSAQELLDSIENTSVLSKITLGEEIEKQILDLNKIIRRVCSDFSHTIKEANITLKFDLIPNMNVHANSIIADIFKNYISNAIKHGGRGGTIEIKSDQNENSVLVYITDTGESISEQNREIIFDRRVRVGSKKTIGTGIGLAIVKRIADAHNGQVWVEPNKPSGNCFCLRLPLRV